MCCDGLSLQGVLEAAFYVGVLWIVCLGWGSEFGSRDIKLLSWSSAIVSKYLDSGPTSFTTYRRGIGIEGFGMGV